MPVVFGILVDFLNSLDARKVKELRLKGNNEPGDAHSYKRSKERRGDRKASILRRLRLPSLDIPPDVAHMYIPRPAWAHLSGHAVPLVY